MTFKYKVNHHLVEIISLSCVHHHHILILFIGIYNQTLTVITIDDDSGDQRSQLIFLLDLLLISVITIHVMISQ
jgi:hypothetical protein